ncbi:diiron oxygenase [Nocardia alni]|uniref:diiron oxygenase n=1 Tax=Nocardia alni TaxID=2815723 RepID=UPI001C224E2D|nr:diiron oxygenase [Nocardia alni]
MGNDAAAMLPRESFAQRLLTGSVKKSYDPVVDLDWDAPLDPDKLFLPAEVISLYGTALWESMTPAERRELSRQELANVLSAGIWFENLLNRLLLRELMNGDPTSNHSHYTLTEMGDETRHMMMFGKLIERIQARPYWPTPPGRLVISSLQLLLRGSMTWVGALVGEEIFDAIQRRTLDDPELQPLVSRAMRVHVTEEARHIGFARDALARRVPTMSRAELAYVRLCVTVAAPLFVHLMTNRHMYTRAGLDGRSARRVARSNPNSKRALGIGAANLGAFLDKHGLITPVGKWIWQQQGLWHTDAPPTRLGSFPTPPGLDGLLDAADRAGRIVRRLYPSSSDPSIPADHEPSHEYSGPALLDAPGAERQVTVTLSGHIDPIDGQYHWYGRVHSANPADLPDPGRAHVQLTLPGRTPVTATLQERDPWGDLRIIGVGEPPFALTPTD